MTDPRKPIFDAVRAAKGRIEADDVATLDIALDLIGIARASAPPQTGPAPSAKRRVSPEGIALIQRYEGCERKLADGRFAAYPDPGSKDGKPWTIGWGSTGPAIAPGTVWTRQQCDDRFANDLQAYADEVSAALGIAPTMQHQFDALVSFHYNTGAIGHATLTRMHIAGNFTGAAHEFAKWNKNDGKIQPGLVRRRSEEAALYSKT